jgi:hypothetical protein
MWSITLKGDSCGDFYSSIFLENDFSAILAGLKRLNLRIKGKPGLLDSYD